MFNVSAILIDNYNVDLMSDSTIRELMSSVAQDAQNETVDMTASIDSITNYIKENDPSDIQTARRAIIGWLNKLFFSGCSGFSITWWWEMHTRIQKLLIVSMVLEGNNLRRFGVTPTIQDIPQSLGNIYQIITQHRKHSFKKQSEKYLGMMNQVDQEFVNLYLNKK